MEHSFQWTDYDWNSHEIEQLAVRSLVIVFLALWYHVNFEMGSLFAMLIVQCGLVQDFQNLEMALEETKDFRGSMCLVPDP